MSHGFGGPNEAMSGATTIERMDAQRDDGAFRRGFLALVPLWLGVVPFALAYAVTAA